MSYLTRYTCLLFLGLLAAHASAADADTFVTYDEVTWLYSDEETLPAPDADWQPLTLPYQQSVDTPPARYAWFRFDLPAPAPSVETAFYFDKHMFDLDVYLNGLRIGGSTAPPGTQAMGWNLPLLVPAPLSGWRAGGNTLHLRLRLDHYTNALSPVLFGPQAGLYALWRAKTFRQGQVSQISVLLCLLLGGFTLALWSQRRDDIQYGLFAGTALFWALPMFYMATSYAPLPHRIFLPAVFIAVNISGTFFLLFLNRLLGLHLERLERFFIMLVAVVSLAIPFVSATLVMDLMLLTDSLSLMVLAAITLLAALQAWRESKPTAYWVCAAAVLVLTFIAHDLFEFSGGSRSNTLISSGTYMQFSFPVVLVLFFVLLIRRFITAMHDYEVLNLALEDRITSISVALEASYRENRQHELREAAEKQKQLIYRDLHDDVGARLVSIMHAKDSAGQARMAQSALASLRESVAGSNMQATDLRTLLTDIVEDSSVRCLNADLEFRRPDLREVPARMLSGTHCYHLTRILREALSNSLQHAAAHTITMEVALDGPFQTLVIRLQDDGRGMPDGIAQGNGMRNIHYRARQLGAEVSWHSPPGQGCQFTLRL